MIIRLFYLKWFWPGFCLTRVLLSALICHLNNPVLVFIKKFLLNHIFLCSSFIWRSWKSFIVILLIYAVFLCWRCVDNVSLSSILLCPSTVHLFWLLCFFQDRKGKMETFSVGFRELLNTASSFKGRLKESYNPQRVV